MEFSKEDIIAEMYTSDIISNIETSDKYKKLLKEYNRLFETIEDDNLKTKFANLEELKNKMYAEHDKQIFKIGFSIATKMIIEALTTEL